MIDTWLTLWEAKRKTTAHNQLAELHRAKANELNAYGEMAKAYSNTARTIHQLDELPEVLALDRAERQAARAGRYAAIDQERQEGEWRTSSRADEHVHKEALAVERRRREIAEAQLAAYGAERKLTYRQKMEAEEEKRWIERSEEAALDHETRIEVGRSRLEEHRGAGSGGSPGTDLDGLRASIERQREAAMSRGDYATQERCEAALKALEG